MLCYFTLISRRCKVESHFKQKQNHGQAEKRNRPCFWDIADPFLRNEIIDKSWGVPLSSSRLFRMSPLWIGPIMMGNIQ